MKRLFAWLLAVCLLCTGCGVIRDAKGVGEKVPVRTLDISRIDSMGSTKKAAVYFLNSDSLTLTADLRLLNVQQDINPAEAAVEALLLGPSNASLTSVAPDGMTLDFIEFSNGVANVYLRYDGLPMPGDGKYIMEMAIANTIVDILGATAVNVFYNGLREGFQGYPSGPLKKQTGRVDEAYKNAKAKFLPAETAETEPNAPLPAPAPTEEAEPVEQGPRPVDLSTVLYFVSASGDYILPEVRTVTYMTTEAGDNTAAYVSAVIDELKKGPKNTGAMSSPVPSGASLESEPVMTDNGDGTRNVALHFDSLPSGSAYTGSGGMMLSYAAIVYSITGFVPGVSEVNMYADGAPVTVSMGSGGAGARRSDFFGYIGSSAPLYFQYANSGLLLEVPRSMEQGKTWSALARVRALMRGPQTGDGASVTTVQYTGMTEDGILSVNVAGDTAYVNLSDDFKQACDGLSAKNEMLLVYAIVNTVTAMDGITKVQFLVEGEQTETLAGHLCISDPFVRNYGIIKNGA